MHSENTWKSFIEIKDFANIIIDISEFVGKLQSIILCGGIEGKYETR